MLFTLLHALLQHDSMMELLPMLASSPTFNITDFIVCSGDFNEIVGGDAHASVKTKPHAQKACLAI